MIYTTSGSQVDTYLSSRAHSTFFRSIYIIPFAQTPIGADYGEHSISSVHTNTNLQISSPAKTLAPLVARGRRIYSIHIEKIPRLSSFKKRDKIRRSDRTRTAAPVPPRSDLISFCCFFHILPRAASSILPLTRNEFHLRSAGFCSSLGRLSEWLERMCAKGILSR